MRQTIHVLFVCSANLCRSVTAVEYARRAELSHRRCDAGRSPIDWQFDSAGTEVMPGQSLPEPVSRTMLDLEIPLHERPNAVSELNVRRADLILTAERHHRTSLARQFPFTVRYTFTLLNFADLLTAGIATMPAHFISSADELLKVAHAGQSRTSPVDDDTIDIADPVSTRSALAMRRCAEEIGTAVAAIVDVGCPVKHH